jgi:hypothetical protein
VCSYLPAVVDASRMAEFPVTGAPAGTVAVRASGLQFHGETVTVAGNAPSAGELAVFCRASHRNWAAAARLSDAYPHAQMVHLPVHAS